LSAKSATGTLARAITLAHGLFAPGHLGELTALVPVELVDAVLAEHGGRQRRLRRLPSRVGVYFVLAMCLFPEVGYLLVWDKLCGGGGAPVRPCAKALRDLRRRVGAVPVRALFEVLAGPVARPTTPGVRFDRWRTVSFDGCSSTKAPDSARNRVWLGKQRADDGYPMLQVMTLVETGTRALLGAVFGPRDSGESAYATRLLHLLRPDMLVLWDKGFDANAFLAAVAATGAQLLGRMRAHRTPPVLARLADGSYLSRLSGVRVRIIEASITVTCADGTRFDGAYRLVTTLTDHRRHPAGTLVRLYHQRWEHESAYYALRHTLAQGRVLRSKDPAGIEQEMWALLTVYQALRTAMCDAVETAPGTDPDRASFIIAHQAARDELVRGHSSAPELVGRIGARVLRGLLPARRTRVSARTVKAGNSRYHAVKPDGRPRTSQNITALQISVHEPPLPAPPEPLPASGADPIRVGTRHTTKAGRINRVLDLLRHQPERVWAVLEIAEYLQETNINSLRVQLSKYAQNGIIRKTAPATYTLLTPPPHP
jgi:hypothetical protein